jgi:hypothetical protein
MHHIHRKTPGNEKALAFGRALLSRIWCTYLRTGEEIPIDPFLLHVKMVFIAACKNSEQKSKKG